MEYIPEDEKFLLLPKEPNTAIHEETLFPQQPSGMFTDITPTRAKSNLREHKTFVGRTRELFDVINLLMDNSLVSIIGAPGIGKTTLATEAGRWFLARGIFPAGIHIMDLRSARETNEVLAAIRATLALESAGIEGIIQEIQGRSILLILDNLETVMESDPANLRELISQLLSSLPRLKILATSRGAIGGVTNPPEKEYRLYSISRENSVELLRRAAPRDISLDELDSEDFHEVFKIIRGHPLSTILIARQLRTNVTFADVRERIEKSGISAVRAPGVDADDLTPEESLEVACLSAYEGCSEEEKKCLHFLSLLPSGMWEGYIDRLLTDIGDPKSSLMELVNKGLAERMLEPVRYFLLPPIQFFGQSKIPDDDKRDYELKIFEFYLGMLIAVGTNWEKQHAANVQAHFRDELGNAMAILDYGEHIPQHDGFEIYATQLGQLLRFSDNTDVAETIVDRALARTSGINASFSFLYGLRGRLLHTRRQYRDAEITLKQALERHGDQQDAQKAKLLELNYLNQCLTDQDKLDEANAVLEQQLALLEKPDSPCVDLCINLVFLSGGTINPMPDVEEYLGNEDVFDKANFHVQGVRWGAVGRLQYHKKDYASARTSFQRSFEEFGKIRSGGELALTDAMLAILYLFDGEMEEARKRLERIVSYNRGKPREVYLVELLESILLDSDETDDIMENIIQLTEEVQKRYEVIRHLEHFISFLEEKGKSDGAKILSDFREKIVEMIPEDLRSYV